MNADRMLVWVVTGPAGAGKSAFTAVLAQLGAAIVDGDRLGHELLERPEIQAEITRRIGAGFIADGVVDRTALGARVFADPAALADLNGITHGPLGALAQERLASLAAAGQHELAVFEAAVYFLLPTPPPADLVIAVVADPEIRARRLVERSGGRLDPVAAQSRVAAQKDLEAHWPRADVVIVNDGTRDELEARALRLWPRPQPGRETLP